MKFVVRNFHFVEVVHTYVMSSVSESLDIKRRKNVVVVHSWEDRSHGSLLNCLYIYIYSMYMCTCVYIYSFIHIYSYIFIRYR